MLSKAVLAAMAAIMGCGGEFVMPHGRSAAIDAFLDAAAVDAGSQHRLDQIARWRELASEVSLDPDAEERRVRLVLEWTTHTYLQIWARETRLIWYPIHVRPTPEEAAEDAEALALQTLTIRAEIRPEPWEDAFAALERRSQLAQARVRTPEAWEALRVPQYRAAWNCRRILANAAGDLASALRATEPALDWIRQAEDAQVQAMIDMQ